MTGAIVLFVLNRYLPIVIFLLGVFFDTSPWADDKVRLILPISSE